MNGSAVRDSGVGPIKFRISGAFRDHLRCAGRVSFQFRSAEGVSEFTRGFALPKYCCARAFVLYKVFFRFLIRTPEVNEYQKRGIVCGKSHVVSLIVQACLANLRAAAIHWELAKAKCSICIFGVNLVRLERGQCDPNGSVNNFFSLRAFDLLPTQTFCSLYEVCNGRVASLAHINSRNGGYFFFCRNWCCQKKRR